MRLKVSKTQIFALAASCLIGAQGWAADAAAPAAQENIKVPSYTLVKERSQLKFIATQNNAPVEGRFKVFDAKIAFDPAHLDKSRIEATVDIASIELADAETKNTLMTGEWFDVAAHPTASFTSTKIDGVPGTDDYYASGKLSIRGKVMPITLNFTMDFMDEKSAVATGYMTVQRTDFGVGEKEWAKDDVVKKAVRVEFRIAADKQP